MIWAKGVDINYSDKCDDTRQKKSNVICNTAKPLQLLHCFDLSSKSTAKDKPLQFY